MTTPFASAASIYLDASYGISGDMLLGAFVGLGGPPELAAERLENVVSTLADSLPPFHAEVAVVNRRGIEALDVRVESREKDPPRRTLPDIVEILERSRMSAPAREQARQIFELLAAAEARVHGCPPAEVHFHEVGAVDSLVDIFGCVLAAEELGADEIVCSSLPLGSGQVVTEHGVYPVPAPATLELLQGVPTHAFAVGREVTTPTGVAVARILADRFGPPPAATLGHIIYAAGTREAPPEDPPNLLRAWRYAPTGRATGAHGGGETISTEEITLLETNIDHVSGEEAGFLVEGLLACGALDAFLVPTIQKKSRPGVLVTVLCTPAAAPRCEEFLFRESGTLGVRVRTTLRRVVPRDIETVTIEGLEVRVKCGRYDGGVQPRPEYDDLRALAAKTGQPLRTLRDRVLAEFWRTRTQKDA